MPPLVQSLFDGPLDIAGDVHGEIHALCSLMQHLGYESEGSHPEGRRLVFVGDLTDRGPDSPAVVDLVKSLVESGRAQCVLGNHDFNILRDHPKKENRWFYGKVFKAKDGEYAKDGTVVPQVLANDMIRERVLAFFRTLPIALVRKDLRVVHACWDNEMIEIVRNATDTVSLFDNQAALIDSELASMCDTDDIDKGLQHQNCNPVKLLTSGPEERAESPEYHGDRWRNERRVLWWNNYRDDPLCVFGHYALCDGESRGKGSAFCVDFGVGYRWAERQEAKTNGFRCRLAVLRLPERMVVFDNGEKRQYSEPAQ